MDTPRRELRLPLDEAVEVLCDLNEFVVSLDRIGSRRAGGDAEDTTVGRFVAEWDLARRLARARGVLSKALDDQLTAAENARIDERCEQGRFFGDPS
ncbi:hypothetical protein ACIA5G_26730 [Amycolatopsis sp. NPDC051758]|uniref:hypothetical protein n=1 Tax=Amycolatopsis sp. NPDC051758 TaxID=3363935 RepID=UPI00378AB8B9